MAATDTTDVRTVADGSPAWIEAMPGDALLGPEEEFDAGIELRAERHGEATVATLQLRYRQWVAGIELTYEDLRALRDELAGLMDEAAALAPEAE